jgi:hypothetical protein
LGQGQATEMGMLVSRSRFVSAMALDRLPRV